MLGRVSKGSGRIGKVSYHAVGMVFKLNRFIAQQRKSQECDVAAKYLNLPSILYHVCFSMHVILSIEIYFYAFKYI